jgi:hypothetical protein
MATHVCFVKTLLTAKRKSNDHFSSNITLGINCLLLRHLWKHFAVITSSNFVLYNEVLIQCIKANLIRCMLYILYIVDKTHYIYFIISHINKYKTFLVKFQSIILTLLSFFAKLHTNSQNLNYNSLYSTRTCHAINDTYEKVVLNGKEKRCEIVCHSS